MALGSDAKEHRIEFAGQCYQSWSGKSTCWPWLDAEQHTCGHAIALRCGADVVIPGETM